MVRSIFARDRLAPCSFVCDRFAPVSIAFVRLAFDRSKPERSAKERSMPVRFAFGPRAPQVWWSKSSGHWVCVSYLALFRVERCNWCLRSKLRIWLRFLNLYSLGIGKVLWIGLDRRDPGQKGPYWIGLLLVRWHHSFDGQSIGPLVCAS